LLGALAACTAIFIGRWAGLKAIPIESVRVRVRATVPLDAKGEPTRITDIEKLTELHADLGRREFEVLDFVAGNCVLGETLKRGTDLEDEIVVNSGRRSALAGFAPLDSIATGRGSEAECGDDACCVVDPAVIDVAVGKL
jgi:hypothetical protein